MFAEELKRSMSHLWALEAEGRCLAYICFWVVAGEIHLMNLAVHPEERRRGYARRLLETMLMNGRSLCATQAWLEVRSSNKVAQALYRSMGFRKMGRRPGYYRDTQEDGILMSLELGGESGKRSRRAP